MEPMSDTPKSLYMQRTGVRQYVARNQDGAEVRVGHGPGMFSPATCSSSQSRAATR